MKRENKFFLIIILSVLITRLSLLLIPTDSWIYADSYHHIYTGIIALVILTIINYEFHKKIFYPFAIVIGMILDEIIYIIPPILEDTNKSSYFAPQAMIYLTITMIVVFIWRKSITNLVSGHSTITPKESNKKKIDHDK